MQLTGEQFERIKDCLPRQRGNVNMDSLQVINAILYVVENGCKWRRLPKHFGNWHSIYTRMSRWSRAGVLDRIFTRLQTEQLIEVNMRAAAPAGAHMSDQPGGPGARAKAIRSKPVFPEEDGGQKFIWLPQMKGAL